jgi:hypothetical protein
MTANGTLSALYTFTQGPDGYDPQTLVAGSDGTEIGARAPQAGDSKKRTDFMAEGEGFEPP